MMGPEVGANRWLSPEDTPGAHSQLVLSQLPMVFWTVDRDLRFTSSFGRGLQEIGLREGQVVGMSLYKFFGTTDAGYPAIKGHLEALTGAYVRYELQWQSRWYESVLSPMRDADGSVIAVAGIAIDISERKKAELRWRAVHEISQAAFETKSLEAFYPFLYRIIVGLMRAENFYIALLDQEGKFLYFPFYRDERDTEWGPIPAYAGLTGYVVRTGRSMIVCASDLERLRETEKVRCVGPEPSCWLGVPLKLPGRTIGVICVQTYDTKECYSAEDLLLLEFVARHIAGAIERRRIEDALAKNERRYRSFIAHSTLGIWCFEADPPIDTSLPEDIQIKEILSRAQLTECNDEFARMYGYKNAREMTGVKLDELLPESDPRTTEYLRNFIRSGYRVTAAETYERDRLGNPKVFLNNFSGEVIEGKLVRAWGTQVDLTEKKKLEEEMIRLQRWESLSLLAAGIAHDFNNLLVGITGNLSLVLAEVDKNTMVANLLEEALQASDRARSLAMQLITFTRGGTPTKKAVDLKRLMPGTIRLALAGTRVKATLSLPADLWQVEGDPSQLEQVFQNLTLNAVEAMPDGGSVTVTAMNRYLEESGGHRGLPLEKGPYVEIHFEDTGIGIPPEDLPHIFEPFYTRKAGGTGLGLAVVYSIVQRH
ncbi:MAG: ATP-binding protein [bacterium JZ-2024 1]